MDPAQRRPVASQGLIGDGRGWALVGHDGAIIRTHVPGSGDPALFNDRDRFTIRPHELRMSRQYYLPDTNVLVTEMHCPTGVVELTDTFTLHPRADLADLADLASRSTSDQAGNSIPGCRHSPFGTSYRPNIHVWPRPRAPYRNDSPCDRGLSPRGRK